MIATVTGTIQSLDAQGAIIDVAGIGYRVMLSARDAQRLTVESSVRVYTYHYIREDNQQLFGFLDVHDLRMFERLISVSGVGPKSAQVILSQLSGVDVVNAILTQDVARLKSISGIGKKTAERLIVELKDSFAHLGDHDLVPQQPVVPTHVDVIQALLALGYAETEIHEVIKHIDHTLPLGEQVRSALQLLAQHSRYAR